MNKKVAGVIIVVTGKNQSKILIRRLRIKKNLFLNHNKSIPSVSNLSFIVEKY